MRLSDLHDYQWKAIDFSQATRKCALFLGLGLGKTVVALTSAAMNLYSGNIKRILVIAPLRVANTVWHIEAANWSHLKSLRCAIATGSAANRRAALDSDSDVFIINVDNVAWLIENYTRKKWRWDCVIVDESSGFKNPSAKRVKALRSATVDKILRVKGKGVFKKSPVTQLMLLSATPATNGLQNLWSQISLIDNGKRLGKSFRAFSLLYFFKPPGSSQHAKMEPLPDSKPKIFNRVRDVCFVMRAEDYITLPPITYNNVNVMLSPSQKTMYKDLEREFLLELETDDEFLTGEGLEIIATNAAALANKLLQFANGAVYTGETPEVAVKDRQYAVIHDAKLDALEDLSQAADGAENLLVAYYYKSDLERLTQRFPQAVVMDKAGDAVIPFNEGKIPMLLAHPQSAGKGLNLQRGSHTIVFFSLIWSLEDYQQFIGRVYRQGQTHGVTVNHIVCAGTIESKVARALGSKAKTQQEFIDALKVVPHQPEKAA